MNKQDEWVLTLTLSGQAGREIGRYSSRDDAMLAAERHFDALVASKKVDEDDDLGWQMGFNGATALSGVGIYRVTRRAR
jgi:hypothetical protein